MTLYINTKTGEYPRYSGDVALDPGEHWSIVQETPYPDVSLEENKGKIIILDNPVLIDGVWIQVWGKVDISTLPQEE